MKRVQGTKGVSLFECINADQNKWSVRWDVQDNPEEEGRMTGVNYMEETFLYQPDLKDVKSVMAIWLSSEDTMGSFILDGKTVTMDRSAILLLDSQAEQAIKENDNAIPMVTDKGVIEVAPDVAAYVAMRAMANYSGNARFLNMQIETLDKAESIEALAATDFRKGQPKPDSMTLEEVKSAIAAAPKTPEQQAVLFAQMTINNTDLTNREALTLKELHPDWKDFVGKSLKTKFRVRYEGRLYRVRQDISTVLANQPPSINTAALYEEINEGHAGTQDDPIPYNNNMELFSGKYYSQGGVTYRCTRNTGQPVYHDLSALVGLYVERA